MHSAHRAHDEHTPARMVIAAAGGYRRLAEYLNLDARWVARWDSPADQRGTGGRIPASQIGPIWRLIRREGWPITLEQLLGVD
ncbi:hypothetical protein [Novispirillum itersonii]|uniref:hypothetical protein n=1 Tax=Novispirillum itersonii TaxID=189 RepID=UPI000370D587|nr:hypothetical protein [Novispirillum itersonii]